jgi:hypothetical protein
MCKPFLQGLGNQRLITRHLSGTTTNRQQEQSMKQRKNSIRKDTSNGTRAFGMKTIAVEDLSITEAVIRRRASEICQERGGAPGQELDDWLQAEREVKAQMQEASEAPMSHSTPASAQAS